MVCQVRICVEGTIYNVLILIYFQFMHEERPLANSESSDSKQAGWIKSKLLGRLSFSVGMNSRTHDKFNSTQRSSDVIDEKGESEQVNNYNLL